MVGTRAPAEVDKALSVGGKSGSYFYLTTASRDYELTEGTRDPAVIELISLGRRALYPSSDDDLADAKRLAFLRVEKFRQVIDYYHGSNIPEEHFVRNKLQTYFQLDPRVYDKFIELFNKHCRSWISAPNGRTRPLLLPPKMLPQANMSPQAR